mmetsp:Transcript_13817/g.17490  ORF Transcript_13817/g.17490 Transcript_13817/m.17490 type:complete len:132 (+) Transcript_13817:381-776(+)|eukprot:CAMPEP_0170452130 /NCGR_PEP_ID=MMETSP0123-20130129/1138_1 /TAXON_ID=182087 /ORGANISM="Favella ehrenbergii, Strain Fehren 1" /LENGTH=131 /DNA_ID=CAMNT_0010714047 /DNA_START=293 /DNA_END=688 /DNA_ORIENTATION=-
MDVGNDGSHSWVYNFFPAVLCRDKYAEWLKSHPDSDVAKKIGSSSKNWVCPDVDEIVIKRNPFLEKDLSGRSFVMVVNDCEVAKGIDATIEFGDIKPYASDVECLASDEARLAQVGKVMIDTMIMGQTVEV